jgi:hypothetical protein
MTSRHFMISVCEQFAAALTRGLARGSRKTPTKTTKV